MEKILMESGNSNMHYYLMIYDIADNKRRYRLSRLMESYGIRVQESSFEFWLDKSHYESLYRKCCRIIKKEDNLRVYILNGKEACINCKDSDLGVQFDVIIM